MTTSRALHRLATNPAAYARFATTGRMPEGTRPSGPLVDLLKQIAPRDLALLIGLTIDARLGYLGSRQLRTAAQALRWVAPADEVFGSFPAESWRNKRFTSPLTVDDLVACCSRCPQGFVERYPRLRRLTPRGTVQHAPPQELPAISMEEVDGPAAERP